MASFNIEMPDIIEQQLSKISNIDELAPQMINAALPIYEKSVRNAVSSVIRNEDGDSTGALVRSVGTTKAKKCKNGGYIGNIVFKGNGRHVYKNKVQVVRNMQKAVSLEYGTAHEAARPFMGKAKSECEQAVIDKMQEVMTCNL